ncbi:MAG: 30S ribosomal protein S20 [Clostridia bacterium]|nr:30S ribosomal protein S20 [Clostridia bacterium]
MANIKSAMKRAKTSVGENLRNRMDKSELKTAVRRFDEALKSGDKEAAEAAYLAAVKTVDQSAAKGVIHKNAADRKKAQLAKKRATANN